ncbi:hypothetical protein BJV82DRAFT_580278 [Fennellomyces sp. T-0311]|nr:hypothetical protein BJV82DRAFT_580278 [Fennellomyces sp. T-0311]
MPCSVAPGSTINDYYWALSYSWNQSGEIIGKDGEEAKRIDRGKYMLLSANTTSLGVVEENVRRAPSADIPFFVLNIFGMIRSKNILGLGWNPLIGLMLQFYHWLTKVDVTILLFGALINYNTDEEIIKVRHDEASLLPSWSGANGSHIACAVGNSKSAEWSLPI